MGKLAHLHPFAGDGGMFHLAQVIAGHVVKNAQHDADPANVIAKQRGQ